MIMLLALATTASAGTTVSQSNDPNAALGVNLTALFGQENAALGQVESGRLTEIVTPPADPSTADAAGSLPATYDAAWVNAVPMAQKSADLDCLARAVYFEARGETVRGQAAVAEVVMNRVDSRMFPRTVCGVVNQANAGGCQFSFVCDGAAHPVSDRTAWFVAQKIASAYIGGAPRDLTKGATYFHTPAVRPSWANRYAMTVRIGAHFFYRAPIITAMN